MTDTKVWEIVLTAIVAVVVVVGGVIFARELPSLRRYLRIKRM